MIGMRATARMPWSQFFEEMAKITNPQKGYLTKDQWDKLLTSSKLISKKPIERSLERKGWVIRRNELRYEFNKLFLGPEQNCELRIAPEHYQSLGLYSLINSKISDFNRIPKRIQADITRPLQEYVRCQNHPDASKYMPKARGYAAIIGDIAAIANEIVPEVLERLEASFKEHGVNYKNGGSFASKLE